MQTPAETPLRVDWPERVGWLLLLWLASVGALGLLALALRMLMHWAGLKTS